MKSFGHHPLLAFLDRPEIAGGEALAGLLRKGNAGSNTAADHIGFMEQALASLPAQWRPDPDTDGAATVVVRSDTAGATHRFAKACRQRPVGWWTSDRRVLTRGDQRVVLNARRFGVARLLVARRPVWRR